MEQQPTIWCTTLSFCGNDRIFPIGENIANVDQDSRGESIPGEVKNFCVHALALIILKTGLLLPACAIASDQDGARSPEDNDAVLVPVSVKASKISYLEQDGADLQHLIRDRVEQDKERLETEGLRAAQWVDSFFSDPNYEAEVVTSQFRLRPELSYEVERGFDATMKASFKYSLPNLERKVSLVGASFDTDTQVEDANDDTVRERSVGVQFFASERKKWHSSFSVGIKDDDWAVTMGPRFRYSTDWGESASFRFTQKVLWQTNSEWQFKTNLNFDYVLSDKFFFRQAVVARWRGEYADEEGTRTQFSTILTRRWKHDAGLQSEATVLFGTVPDTHVLKYLLAFRYRKRAWREWFYYEIVPQVTWEERFDYDFNPGIRFRVEIFYGKGATTRYWSRRPEDRDGFHW